MIMIIKKQLRKNYNIITIFLLLLVGFSCSSDDKNSAGPDLNPQSDGFVFEWSRVVSDGWIFAGEGSSCDGISWTGTVTLSGVNSSGASVNSSGTFSFVIPDGSTTGQTTILTSGTMIVDDNILTFTDPLPMIFELSENTMQAEISIASVGDGLLNTPIGPITFASVFVTESNRTFVVILTDNPNCK